MATEALRSSRWVCGRNNSEGANTETPRLEARDPVGAPVYTKRPRAALCRKPCCRVHSETLKHRTPKLNHTSLDPYNGSFDPSFHIDRVQPSPLPPHQATLPPHRLACHLGNAKEFATVQAGTSARPPAKVACWKSLLTAGPLRPVPRRIRDNSCSCPIKRSRQAIPLGVTTTGACPSCHPLPT